MRADRRVEGYGRLSFGLSNNIGHGARLKMRADNVARRREVVMSRILGQSARTAMSCGISAPPWITGST